MRTQLILRAGPICLKISGVQVENATIHQPRNRYYSYVQISDYHVSEAINSIQDLNQSRDGPGNDKG